MTAISSTGIGLRGPHLAAIVAAPPAVGFLEVHPENYMGGGPALGALERLRRERPISLHGVGLSLGGTDGIDQGHLERLAGLVERLEPVLVSEHLSWSIVEGVYLNDLLPLPYTEEALDLLAAHIDQVQTRLRRQILVENPSSYLSYQHSTIEEPAFLAALPAEAIGEFHLAGHSINDIDGQEILIDDHGSEVAAPVWALYRAALRRFGPRPALIEWDSRLPALPVLLGEAAKADAAIREETGNARAA